VTALARIVRAREALEDGDIGFAYELLTDLEHDLAGESPDFEVAPQSLLCPDCGLRFTWPGQLADHRDFVHWRAAA
jgi:rubredoxin